MEIDFNVLAKQQAEVTTGTKKMRMSEHATSMIFQMFTKNIYSNPIGTVVREITSNCFDSHTEAGVNHPVLIKLSYDEQTESHHISFIDYGVGMSPDRIENVYGVYFESTKRTNNNEIGGFGIGGKTPLAYRRFIGEGEGEYDNSFYVITNYNGVKYYYNVYEGVESPEFSLFHKENTTEKNGTEIRIPVLETDISKFESECLKQLYYFENIVFEGFSDRYVKNEYQIIQGKNFLYRGNGVDNYIHVCLGRVYYPINYSTLGLNNYDYNLPVAIKVPIGEINVTTSREQLDYSEKTIKFLKQKLSDVKEELRIMISKQYENVVSLEDYFKFKNNFGDLELTNDVKLNLRKLINKSDVDLSNFQYAELDELNSETLFNYFFITRRYGRKENRYYSSSFTGRYTDIVQKNNLYYVDGEFNRKMIKQSWLKNHHERYFILFKKNINVVANELYMNKYRSIYNDLTEFMKSREFKLYSQIYNEYYDIITKETINYDELEVPAWYKEDFGKKKVGKDILKETIVINLENRYSKDRVTINNLLKFRGIIFYGTQEDKYTMSNAYRIYKELFNTDHITSGYSSYNNEGWGKKSGIMFITVAKNNVKYFNYCKNAHHVSTFLFKMVRRKIDIITDNFVNESIITKKDELDRFYFTDIFKSLSPSWSNKVEKVQDYIDNMISISALKYMSGYLKPLIDLDNVQKSAKTKVIEKHLDSLLELQEKNRDVMKYIQTPGLYSTIINKEMDAKILPKILKKVMSL